MKCLCPRLTVVAAVLATALAAPAAVASTIAITPDTAVDAEIEGNAGVLNFTVTNITGHDVTLGGLGFAVFKTMNDATDDPRFNPLSGGCKVGLVLASGAQCGLSLTFSTPKTTGGEEDLPDFGLTRVRVLAGASDGSSAIAEGLVRVDDVPVVRPPAVLVAGSTVQVLEGQNGTLTFTISNISDNPAMVAGLTLSSKQFPDITDDAAAGALAGCAKGTLIAANGFCTVTLPFTTPKTVGEKENTNVGFTEFDLAASLDNGAANFGSSVVEVLDPSVLTPEPGTFAMCGLVLAGLLAGRWRARLSRATRSEG